MMRTETDSNRQVAILWGTALILFLSSMALFILVPDFQTMLDPDSKSAPVVVMVVTVMTISELLLFTIGLGLMFSDTMD